MRIIFPTITIMPLIDEYAARIKTKIQLSEPIEEEDISEYPEFWMTQNYFPISPQYFSEDAIGAVKSYQAAYDYTQAVIRVLCIVNAIPTHKTSRWISINQ